MSPHVPSSCMNRLAVSPGVARYLSPVAPRLAPRNLVNLANVRMVENNVGRGMPCVSTREPAHPVGNAVSSKVATGTRAEPPIWQLLRFRLRSAEACRAGILRPSRGGGSGALIRLVLVSGDVVRAVHEYSRMRDRVDTRGRVGGGRDGSWPGPGVADVGAASWRSGSVVGGDPCDGVPGRGARR